MVDFAAVSSYHQHRGVATHGEMDFKTWGVLYISNERNRQSLMFGHTDQQDTASTTVVPTTGTVLQVTSSLYSSHLVSSFFVHTTHATT